MGFLPSKLPFSVMLRGQVKHAQLYAMKLLNWAFKGVVPAVIKVNTNEPVAALTFDDGPNPEATPEILDILQHYQAKATFFIVGKKASIYPEIIERAGQEGHNLGNHTWDHTPFPLLTKSERIEQLKATERVIAPFNVKLFRPPWGYQTLSSYFDVRNQGYKVIAWNFGGMDWLGNDDKWISNRIFQLVCPGSIIMLHDNLYFAENDRFADRTPTIIALKEILENLSKQYRFVTVTELLKLGKPVQKFWYSKPDTKWLGKLKEF